MLLTVIHQLLLGDFFGELWEALVHFYNNAGFLLLGCSKKYNKLLIGNENDIFLGLYFAESLEQQSLIHLQQQWMLRLGSHAHARTVHEGYYQINDCNAIEPIKTSELILLEAITFYLLFGVSVLTVQYILYLLANIVGTLKLNSHKVMKQIF